MCAETPGPGGRRTILLDQVPPLELTAAFCGPRPSQPSALPSPYPPVTWLRLQFLFEIRGTWILSPCLLPARVSPSSLSPGLLACEILPGHSYLASLPWESW